MSAPILTGAFDFGELDVGERDVSSTTFVLPFAYHLERVTGQAGNDASLWYHQVDVCGADSGVGIDTLRPRYFSRETAKSLYESARWFEIEANAWQDNTVYPTRFTFERDGRELAVELLPPRLVLFEWDQDADSSISGDVRHTGFLLLQACFPDGVGWCFDDLLAFNESFRYTGSNHPAHFQGIGRPYRELIEKLGADEDAERLFFQERWLRLLRDLPIRDSKDGLSWLCGREDSLDKLMPIADNRALVWSAAVLQRDGVGSICAETEDAPLCGNLVRFVNVDPPGDQAPSDFEKDWLKDRIYTRWLHSGSLYGFTSHSGVMVASRNNHSPIATHFQRIYLDMFLLVCYLRISLYRFNIALVESSGDIRSACDDEAERRFEVLRRNFTVLTNLYQFAAVSNQQQAQEMYPIIRRVLDVDALFQETATEIDNTHRFLQLLNDKRTQEKLNWFGGVIGVFTVFDVVLNHLAGIAWALLAITLASVLCLGTCRTEKDRWLNRLRTWSGAAWKRLGSWCRRA